MSVGSMSEEILLARALLNRAAEPASIPLWAAVEEHGPVEVANAVRAGRDWVSELGLGRGRVESADPRLDLEAAERHGIRLVVPESDEWPHFAFAALYAAGERRLAAWRAGARTPAEGGEPIPPIALWARGELDLATIGTRSVAVVGARANSDYGADIARQWSFALAQRGFAIVSGGAFGIDAVAHRAALDAGGATVLVSAGGLDRPYPAAHHGLYERVAETGLCLSESPPGSAPRRRRFLTRNRLIAALGTGTIVVEAARRSGAINTANHCVTLDRPLMAVPG
jgi:DNA processing protein